MDRIRIDKWLWSVRLFKSRTMATDACKAGRVKVNEKNAKPALEVLVNDTVLLKKNGFEFTFLVKQILKSRVGAPLAIEAYDNKTPEEELNKYKLWFVGKGQTEFRDRGTGRPTKKERREIDDFKGDYLDFDYWDEDED